MAEPLEPLSEDQKNLWPNIVSEGHEVKSRKTLFSDIDCIPYNCIAFAAGDEQNWWEPDADGFWTWPIAKREMTIECYVEAYQSIGYEECADGHVELGFEKIAIYALDAEPTHAAKQLPNGKWKSKLGQLQDIEHNTLRALEDSFYGTVDRYMKRAIPNA